MKRFKKLSALIASTLLTTSLFVGCGNSNVGENGTINFFNVGDYIDEALIRKFEKETGIKVNYSTYDTNEIMYQKVKTNPGTYDLVVPSDYMIEKMIEEDLLEKIDFNNIPNYQYIGDDYKNLSYDPSNEYSVPYMWGTIGIIYDSTRVTEPVTSWDILWDSKYKDEVFMFDNMRDTIGVALKTLGYSLNSTNEEELKEAGELLIKQKKELNPTYGADEVLDLMRSGEKSIAMIWSGEGLNLEAEDDRFKYVIPEEGADFWLDSWAIPKSAKNVSGAEKFIDFMSSKDIALRTADEIGYTTPQKQAMEEQADEIKNNENAYMPQEILDKCEGYKFLDKENLELYQEVWIKVKS